jgi:ribonuclease Z
VIRPEEAVDPPRPGRKIVYTGDTSPSDELAKFAEGADLLIHDATFDQTLAKRSEQEGHSTAASAAEIALKARVKMLALFHISPRYHGREEILLNEARKIFPATILPNDLETLEIPYPERGLSV